MTMVFSTLLDRADKYAKYRRTVKTLRSLPVDVALDLDLYPGDAEKIASRAVYGA